MRSALWAALLPGAAFAAALGRWHLQGSANLYTAFEKRFYVPDPDLGWRVTRGGPLWIGLDVIAICLAVAIAVVIGALIVRRWERRRGSPMTGLRIGLWIVGALPLAVPGLAFRTGLGPNGGQETLPKGAAAAPPETGDGIEGGLSLPAGRYEVVSHDGSSITASLEAGKEAFEARFARGIRGSWTGDPRDLSRPLTVEISLDAAGVDTGIGLRSQHARDEYLRTATYPTIAVRVVRLIATRQDGPALVGFRAGAEVDFLGEKIPVELTGTLRAPDPAGRARLGLAASDSVVLANAVFELSVRKTRLREDADSFDRDRIPIQISLVLVRRG